jgi:hypothetical protein
LAYRVYFESKKQDFPGRLDLSERQTSLVTLGTAAKLGIE